MRTSFFLLLFIAACSSSSATRGTGGQGGGAASTTSQSAAGGSLSSSSFDAGSSSLLDAGRDGASGSDAGRDSGLGLGTAVWAKQFQGAGSATPTAVAVDSFGNVVLGGHFSGALSFGGNAIIAAGTLDGFLVKLDPTGTEVAAWPPVRFGTAGTGAEVVGIALDTSNNIYIVGEISGTVSLGSTTFTQGSILIAKFDPSMNLTWAQAFGGPSDTPFALSVSGTNVFVGGGYDPSVTLGNTLSLSGPLPGWFVGQVEANDGGAAWVQSINGYPDWVAAIATDSSGNVYAVGPNEPASSIDAGTSYQVNFLAKYDVHGANAWINNWGGSAYAHPSVLAVDSFGAIYSAGSYSGGGSPTTFTSTSLTLPQTQSTATAFAVKFDATFSPVWAQGYPQPDPTSLVESVAAVSLTPNGVLVQVGTLSPPFSETDAGTWYSAWEQLSVRKVDATTGNQIWYGLYGDKLGYATGRSIAVDANGFLYVAGTNSFNDTGGDAGSVDFGAGTTVLTATSYQSIILAKIAGK